MNVQIWNETTGEWRTVPGVVSVSLDPLADAIAAMSRQAAEAASAVERFAEAFHQAAWPAVPLTLLPCPRDHVQPTFPGTLTWPHQQGKHALLSGEITVSGLLSDALRIAFEPLFAAARAGTERRVARLAADLGLYPETARRLFDRVQQVLEEAGIGDGFGRLTIRQPVCGSVEPPAVPRLVTVYPHLFDPARRGRPGTPLPLTLRSLPRPGP